MSMRSYPVSETGIVLKISEVNWAAVMKKTNTEYSPQELSEDDLIDVFDDDTVWLGESWSDGVIAFKRGLCGDEADGEFRNQLKDSTCSGINDVDAARDDWVIFCLPRYPSLFKQAYKDEASLLNEIKKIYSRYIKAKDFDYASRLVEYSGTIYG